MGIEDRAAKFFQMSDSVWERHANPWSVWTRYPCLPLLALAVPSVDRVAKRDTDCLGLPVDLDKSSSVQQAEIQRPLGVESCAWRASVPEAPKIRSAGPSSQGHPQPQYHYVRWISVGDIRSCRTRRFDDRVRHYRYNARQNVVSGPDGLVVSGSVLRRQRIFQLAILNVGFVR